MNVNLTACLKVLTKDELIRCIVSVVNSHPGLSRAFKIKMISIYERKLNQIIDQMDACDLLTVDGRINYFKFEKEYVATQAAFDTICEA